MQDTTDQFSTIGHTTINRIKFSSTIYTSIFDFANNVMSFSRTVGFVVSFWKVRVINATFEILILSKQQRYSKHFDFVDVAALFF